VSAWRARILTLGLLFRQVTVDPVEQQVSIRRRFLWFFQSTRQIPFKAVKGTVYGYRDCSPGLWLSSWSSSEHDSLDLYSTALLLDGEEEVHLFYFLGDGTISNNTPWSDLFSSWYLEYDASGTQDQESLAFVNIVSKLLGAKVIPGR
jgi:hypothetical protein